MTTLNVRFPLGEPAFAEPVAVARRVQRDHPVVESAVLGRFVGNVDHPETGNGIRSGRGGRGLVTLGLGDRDVGRRNGGRRRRRHCRPGRRRFEYGQELIDQ